MSTISTTNIVHSVRAALRITCDQYAVADAIDTLHLRKRPTTVRDLSFYLGMTQEEITHAITFLVVYEIVTGAGEGFKCTQKWASQFSCDVWFDNPLPPFTKVVPADYQPGFWQIYSRVQKRGSKPQTQKRYLIAIKTVSKEDLNQAAINYTTSTDPQYVMYPQKFLHPTDKHYEAWLPKKEVQGFGEMPLPAGIKDMSGMI